MSESNEIATSDEIKRRNEQNKNCRCKPKCLDCRDGVHDGCMYGCR